MSIGPDQTQAANPVESAGIESEEVSPSASVKLSTLNPAVDHYSPTSGVGLAKEQLESCLVICVCLVCETIVVSLWFLSTYLTHQLEHFVVGHGVLDPTIAKWFHWCSSFAILCVASSYLFLDLKRAFSRAFPKTAKRLLGEEK